MGGRVVSGQVTIEFDEIIRRRVTVDCADTEVAKAIWFLDCYPADLRDAWVVESAEVDDEIDWNSASFYPVTEPGLV